MELQDMGLWLSPDGEVIDVYQSPEKTHEGVADKLLGGTRLGFKNCTSILLQRGWIRISMGTVFNVFNLRRKERNLIRQFLAERQDLYQGVVIELQEDKKTRMLPVEYFLKEE